IPVSTLVTLTEAPGTTAPVLSVTVPTMEPVVVWAVKGGRPSEKQVQMTRISSRLAPICYSSTEPRPMQMIDSHSILYPFSSKIFPKYRWGGIEPATHPDIGASGRYESGLIARRVPYRFSA